MKNTSHIVNWTVLLFCTISRTPLRRAETDLSVVERTVLGHAATKSMTPTKRNNLMPYIYIYMNVIVVEINGRREKTEHSTSL